MEKTLLLMKEIRLWIIQVFYVPTVIATALIISKKLDKKEKERNDYVDAE